MIRLTGRMIEIPTGSAAPSNALPISDIANTLREGARADIWYLADRHEEPHILRQIEEVQEAMEDAATALPQLIAALGWALDQIENDADPDHQAAFAAARATFEQYSREAA